MSKHWTLALIVFLACPGTAEAACTDAGSAQWLIGEWRGVINVSTQTRTLTVTEISVTANGLTAKGTYGITDEKMGKVLITLPSCDELTFTTGSKSVITAKRNASGHLAGEFRPKDKKPADMLFWNVATAKGGGSWEGMWSNGVSAKLEVAYLDGAAASVLYEWGAMTWPDGSRLEPGSRWRNAAYDPRTKSLSWSQYNNTETFTFTLGNGVVTGEISSQTPASIRMKPPAK